MVEICYLVDLKAAIFFNYGPQSLRIVSVPCRQALVIVDYIRSLVRRYGWRIEDPVIFDRLKLLSYLDRALVIVDGVALPRLHLDVDDDLAYAELARSAAEVYAMGRAVGGSIQAPAEALRDTLEQIATAARNRTAGAEEEELRSRMEEARTEIDNLRSLSVNFHDPPSPYPPPPLDMGIAHYPFAFY